MQARAFRFLVTVGTSSCKEEDGKEKIDDIFLIKSCRGRPIDFELTRIFGSPTDRQPPPPKPPDDSR
jgi:hypothetical protein